MKSIKPALLLLLLLSPLTATVARAQHAHFAAGVHGSTFHGFRGHGAHVGVFVDPWPVFSPYGYGYYPYDYYPYGYYPPVVVTQPAAPTVYVEQGAAPVQDSVQQPPQSSAPSNDWYYCRNPEGYYPYVRNCANGWQRVPAQPPTQR